LVQSNAVEQEALADRRSLRDQLAATRDGFHALLDLLSDDELRLQSGNPAWSVGEVLSHVVSSLELVPREVAGARRGKGMYNFPPFLRDRLNVIFTRRSARGQTLHTLRKRYDDAYDAALLTLDDVREDELDCGANFWSEGFKDIRALYTSQAHHLAEHAPDVNVALQRRTG
jgi:hypothetical protein